MSKAAARPKDLKEACVSAAHAVIAEKGVDHLSLREVARKLGVSHQAPYKHFTNRDALLAEVIRRCYVRFAASLDARAKSKDPNKDMENMGRAYLAFARDNPLEYHLMFSSSKPLEDAHPDLDRDARHAFDILRNALRQLHVDGPGKKRRVDLDALFVWSSMHGLATLTQQNPAQKLGITPSAFRDAAPHVLDMISKALRSEDN